MTIPELIIKNKPVFGAYAIMAMNNVQSALKYIHKIYDIENDPYQGGVDCDDYGNPKEDDVWGYNAMEHINPNPRCQIDFNKTDDVVNALCQRFSFLQDIAEINLNSDNKYNKRKCEKKDIQFTPRMAVDLKDFYWQLRKSFSVLKAYRDYCAHHVIYNPRINQTDFLVNTESPLSYSLNDLFTCALRKAKERFQIPTEDLRFIQDKRYKLETINGKRKMVLDQNFFLSIQNNNGDAERLHLSGVGVAFLICLFLEKKYINLFLQKLPIYGEHGANSKEADIIRKTFSFYSINLPKERIKSSEPDFAVALDMLNELKKCPKELFDTLPTEKQNLFRVKASDGGEALLMRHSDRFVPLCMKFIDINCMFPTIRFQVNCGQIHELRTTEKHCIDDNTRVRVLTRNLNGFGRIQEVEQFRKRFDEDGKCYYLNTDIPIREFEDVRRDDANPDNYPYINDCQTKYVFQDNQVALAFNDVMCNPAREDWNGNWRQELNMSTLEFPAMMFYMLLCGSVATENIIRSTQERYIRLFEDFRDGKLNSENIGSYGIELADIPTKIKEAISGTSSQENLEDYVRLVLEQMLDDTERRIERIERDRNAIDSAIDSADNKLGKKGYVRIKTGKLADFLAEDIVRFQPTNLKGKERGNDKLTGLNYRVLQAAIATYSTETTTFEEFNKMFWNAKLVGCLEKMHPFLYNVLARKPKNTVDFYVMYLNERKKHIERLRLKLAKGITVTLPFINEEAEKWRKRDASYYKDLAERYLSQPIDLPRQMFDKAIKEHLGIESDDNITYIIADYLKSQTNDDFQQFYSYPRNYKYMDILNAEFEPKTGSLKTNYFKLAKRENLYENREDAVKKYYENLLDLHNKPDQELTEILNQRIAGAKRDFQKIERLIRRYKVQDAVMFLLAKDMVFNDNIVQRHNSTDNDSQFKLKDIAPTSDKDILSQPLDISLYLEHHKINARGIKIKDYGNLIHLLYDKRMKSLLPLLQEEIEKESLDSELGYYDDNRVNFIKIIQGFEQAVLTKYPDFELHWNHNDGRFDFKAIINILRDYYEAISYNDGEHLREIRNAFDHNSYPRQSYVSVRELPEIAKTLIGVFKQKSTLDDSEQS